MKCHKKESVNKCYNNYSQRDHMGILSAEKHR
jgi:hypothetical protein